MNKFGVRFFDGSCKVFECKSVFGVKFLVKMYLCKRKNDIDMMLCFVNGGIWKWKNGKWEEKKKCNEIVRVDVDWEILSAKCIEEYEVKKLRQLRIKFD